MAEGYLNRWLRVSSPQEAEMHLPGQAEPLEVVWLSGSAIAVPPRSNPPAAAQNPPEELPRENLHDLDYYDSSNDSDATIDYRSTDATRILTVNESEDENSENDFEQLLEDVLADLHTEGAQEYVSESEQEASNGEGNQEDDLDLEREPVNDDSNMDGVHEYLSELEAEPAADDSNTGGNRGNNAQEVPAPDVLIANDDNRSESGLESALDPSNIDGNSVFIIEHEGSTEPLAQEPNVVTVPENPAEGVENPIIRLENPDYEPESCKNVSLESNRFSNKRSYGDMMSDEDEDGQTCPVCFDVWTNEGDHRLSALKCGHLFGKSCITRWLSKEKKKFCPQCNKKAHLNDVRELYATKLTALDSSERARLEKELQTARDEKNKAEAELERCKVSLQHYKDELETLKGKITKLTGDINNKNCSAKTESKQVNRVIKFHLEKTFEINEGCCRVCAYDALTNILVVSHQTRNQLFPGFGIKKIQKVGTDYFSNNFLYLHPKALRDISFHPVTPNLILTVSFDRSAKLVDLKQHCSVETFKADYPLWSCCWDLDDHNYFYAGAGNGCIHIFDVRLPAVSIAFLNRSDDTSAVVAVRYVQSKPPFRGGIICARLNTLTIYEKIGPAQFNSIPITNFVGPFFSLSYDPSTAHVLISCRPSEESPKVRHIYCEFSGTSCRRVHTFCGGTRQTLLSRSCFMKINDETVVAVFHENSNSIDIWSTATGAKIQSIPVSDQILDIAAVQMENRSLFSTVSDSLVRFYETSNVTP